MEENIRKCEYTECIAEANSTSNIYLIKLIILTIGAACLIRSPGDFNFITLALYISPIMLDNGTGILKLRRLKSLRNISLIIKALNGIVLIFCALGIIGFFLDNGDSFISTKDALLFNNVYINKSTVAKFIFINIIYTGVMLFVPIKKGESETILRYQQLEQESAEEGLQ